MVLWGHKSDAFLDFWSIEHLLMGIGLGGLWFLTCRFKSANFSKHNFYHQLCFVLMLSASWEMIEHYLETGLAGEAVKIWFDGVEHWSNRLISDHLMVILGVLIYNKYSFLLWPARALSLIWLYVHIFIFPNSMYLHSL